jgi:hypothetical protein
MKRINLIIAIILMAQMSFAQHYVGFGASLSSPFQVDKSNSTKPLFGWGEGIHVQYQYCVGHFIVSAGATLTGEHPRVGVDDEDFVARMRDTRHDRLSGSEGIVFDYLGSVIKRKDLSSTVWLNFPVMVGLEIFPFYVMAGAEYSLFLASWTHQTAQMASIGDYLGRYYKVVDDMPTHGYHTYEPVETKGRMQYKNDIRVLFEIGGTIPFIVNRRAPDHLLRIGAFAEVGLRNVLNNSTNIPKTEWDVSQYMHVRMNHVYASNANTGAVRNIVVGVKATYLLPIGELPKKFNGYRYIRRTKKKCNCFGYPAFKW